MNNNYQQQPVYNQQTKYNQTPKKSNLGCIIAAIVIIFVVIVMGVIVIGLVFATSNSKKLICKSNEGDITILYNDKTIVGYTTRGMTYDLDAQKQYAEQVGIDAYLDEFAAWFSNNTTGTCTR